MSEKLSMMTPFREISFQSPYSEASAVQVRSVSAGTESLLLKVD